MSKIRIVTYQLGVLLCLMTGLLLSACSGDSTSDSPVSDRQIRLTAGTRQFSVDEEEAVSPAATRSVTYPNTTDWQKYVDHSNMLVFMAKSKENPSSSDVLSRLCSFSSANADWQANVTITDVTSKYNIFGFMPIDIENSSDNVSISRLPSKSNYDAGAQMTIRGLKVLTLSDPCVIVGVTEPDANNNYNLKQRWGKFDFTFKQNTTGDVTDYMSILVDHIYSRFNFTIKIDADYAQMRTIRVTKMTLEALSDDGTKTLRSVDATVSITANTTNTNPITGISFSRNTGERSVTIFDKTTTTNTDYTNGIVLAKEKTDFQDVGYCLAPCNQRWFRLTTEYEVLDRTGKLIRTNTVPNTFNTANFKEKVINSTTPGLDHTIQIIVNPTYLYVLTDSDLDNPPIGIN